MTEISYNQKTKRMLFLYYLGIKIEQHYHVIIMRLSNFFTVHDTKIKKWWDKENWYVKEHFDEHTNLIFVLERRGTDKINLTVDPRYHQTIDLIRGAYPEITESELRDLSIEILRRNKIEFTHFSSW